ncbi:MAG: 4-(cytidine 5'-diphospho)-2-C-methyl-D-erythritol kinase [Rhodospirillaceae bacterium]|nr:4-(cytidine 5'-diphospho)-2-C-methyl-D-erythritol kinase [Rhodospirillaceae bacterium]
MDSQIILKKKYKKTAPAKINFFLHILSKRADSFHEVESLIGFTEFGDKVSVEESNFLELIFEGPMSGNLPRLEENIVFEAVNLLRKEYNISSGARIKIEKNIPIAGGLGGGSSDAAAVIDCLTKLWDLRVPKEILGQKFLALGVDFPVCLKEETTFVKGKGEVCFSVANNFSYPILLVNPRKQLRTEEVFSKVDLSNCYKKSINKDEIYIDNLKKYQNDLLNSATVFVPQIKEIIKLLLSLNGCIFANLSGSGPTCFGIFDDMEKFNEANRTISENFDWWVMPTFLKGK